jgi:hypothetical protein
MRSVVTCRRHDTNGHGSNEECFRSRQIPTSRQHDVDDLTVLINGSVQVGPAACDLDVGFVDEPAIAWQPSAGASGLDELRGEPLRPAVAGHVIDRGTALG